MDEELNKNTSINLPLGHLLVVWNVLSTKLSSTPYKEEFTDEETRAIRALEDLCEKELVDIGIADKYSGEWDQIMERANEFAKTIPAEFLD